MVQALSTQLQQMGDDIRQHLDEVAVQVADKSEEVTAVLQDIGDIARLVNLLALNARACRGGRAWFAVAADEVRRQTQRSLLSGQDATVDEFLAQFHDSSRRREIEQAWQGTCSFPRLPALNGRV